MATISVPKNLYIHYKENTVARTDTTDKEMFILPAGSTPLYVVIRGETASDAATTAVVDVGKTTDDDFFVAAHDVKTANSGDAATVAPTLNTVTKLTVDTLVTANYAETGTASTTGGPWTVGMFYIRA